MKAPLHMMSSLKTFLGHRNTNRCFAIIILIAVLTYSPADASSIPVRFPEGVTHGFLLVRSLAGEIIGQGEMTQVAKEPSLKLKAKWLSTRSPSLTTWVISPWPMISPASDRTRR